MQIMRAAASFQRKHFVFQSVRPFAQRRAHRIFRPLQQGRNTILAADPHRQQGGYPNIVHMVVNTGDSSGFTPSMTTEADVLRRGMKS